MKRLFILLLLVSCFYAGRSQKVKPGLVFTHDSVYRKTLPAVLPLSRGELPAMVDLSDRMPPVGNQRPQNSCVAWAIGYGARSYYNPIVNKQAITRGNGVDYSAVVSPSFIYNLLNEGKNKGLNMQQALRLLMDTGACSYQTMPYEKYNWVKKPRPKQIEEASSYRIEAYRKIDLTLALLNFKGELISGNPVVCATNFDTRYYNYGNNTKEEFYVWDTMGPVDKQMGHAIVIVGFNDSLKAFKFMNSWGTDWGNKGYGWISYRNVKNAVREAYIIKPAYPRAIEDEVVEVIRGGPKDSVGRVVIEPNEVQEVRPVSLPAFYVSSQSVDTTDVNNPNLLTIIRFKLPKGYAENFELAVQYFFDDNGKKGEPVLSKNAGFKLMNGQAAAGTGPIEYSQLYVLEKSWKIAMPLSALDLPQQNAGAPYNLWAEAVLFLDGFPVQTADPQKVQISR